MSEPIKEFKAIKACNHSLATRRLLFGIGLNDAWYQVIYRTQAGNVTCTFYKTWSAMLKRCYHKTTILQQPTYDGCSVCIEWHTFSNFKAWMETQDWEGKELDKDLLVKDNKVYSPETCVFISSSLNRLCFPKSTNNSNRLAGITLVDGKYVARCNINGSSNYLGYFKSELEAHKAFLTAKKAYILTIAEQQEPKLKTALISRAELLC
jgi:hypothetical protein